MVRAATLEPATRDQRPHRLHIRWQVVIAKTALRCYISSSIEKHLDHFDAASLLYCGSKSGMTFAATSVDICIVRKQKFHCKKCKRSYCVTCGADINKKKTK